MTDMPDFNNNLSADGHRDAARELLTQAQGVLHRAAGAEWASQRSIALSTMALTHATLAGQLDRIDRETSVAVVQGTLVPDADNPDDPGVGGPVPTGGPVNDNDNTDTMDTDPEQTVDQDWTVGVRVVHPSNHLPVAANLVHDALDDLGINFETHNRAVTAEITIVAPDRKTAASETRRVLNSAFPHDTILIEDIVSDL